jgi:tetratricopeptide (TPR) repeat protein
MRDRLDSIVIGVIIAVLGLLIGFITNIGTSSTPEWASIAFVVTIGVGGFSAVLGVATLVANRYNERLREQRKDTLERQREAMLAKETLAMREQRHEFNYPDMASTLTMYVDYLRDQGEVERARELDEQALEMRQRLFEGDHPDVAASLNSLANDLRALGEVERARELDEQTLEMQRRLKQRKQ